MELGSAWVGILLAAGFIAWVLYLVWPARIVFVNDSVVKRHRWKYEKIDLADLSQIKFHYYAVSGFACEWEFIAASGKSFSIKANGIDKRLLLKLEQHLPNFSAEHFYKEFNDGDVKDSLEVWSAA